MEASDWMICANAVSRPLSVRWMPHPPRNLNLSKPLSPCAITLPIRSKMLRHRSRAAARACPHCGGTPHAGRPAPTTAKAPHSKHSTLSSKPRPAKACACSCSSFSQIGEASSNHGLNRFRHRDDLIQVYAIFGNERNPRV